MKKCLLIRGTTYKIIEKSEQSPYIKHMFWECRESRRVWNSFNIIHKLAHWDAGPHTVVGE